MKYKNIYVAATSQHVGKTTSTLGLVSGFLKRGYDVGYCKPVGQEFLNINNILADKDAVLFASLINFEINPDFHSPVILGSGETQRFLDNPERYTFHEDILRAKEYLEDRYQLTIYEGTGHPGVGSVGNISNARVAKLLNAKVIIVVPGGIGNTIDKLNMSMALFREEGVEIIGVIINKVIPEKLNKVRTYVSKWLNKYNIPLLGVVPYDPTLGYPIIKTINSAVEGTIIYNAGHENNKVVGILAGSLFDLQDLKESADQLLVVSIKSINSAINKIDRLVEINNIGHSPLSGIVATGGGTIDSNTLKYIEDNNIPLIRTHLDTYGCAVKISRIEVKINQNTPWKVEKAIDLIGKHADFDAIADIIKI